MIRRFSAIVWMLLALAAGSAQSAFGQTVEDLRAQAELLRESREVGQPNAELGRVLSELGWAEIAQGDALAAGNSFTSALEELEPTAPNLYQALALAGLAMIRQYEGSILVAEDLYRRSVEALISSGNGKLAERAGVEKNLADLLMAQGRLEEAETLYRGMVDLWSELFGKENELVESIRVQWAGLLQALAREDEAKAIYGAILESRSARLGPLHPSTLEMVAAVVSVDVTTGRYAEAAERTREALEALEAAETAAGKAAENPAGKASADRQRAVLLDNLARIEAAAGRYGRAIEVGGEALALAEICAPAELFLVEGIRINLATIYRDAGDYRKAEPLYVASRSKLKAAGAEGGDFEGTLLHELGRLYADIGDVARARELFEATLSIYRTALSADHYYVATALGSLAALELDENRPEKAEELFRKAAEIYERCFGEQSLYTARAFGNLAATLQAQERYAEAKDLLDRSISLLGGLVGFDHPDTAYYINNRGVLAISEKRFDEGRTILEEAVGNLEKTIGPMHPATSRIRHNLAYVNGILGNSTRSVELFREVLEAEEVMLENVFAMSSERQKLAFVEKSSWTFDRFLSLVDHRFRADRAVVELALDAVLARKAIVFDAQSRERTSLGAALGPEDRERWRQLAEVRAALARALLSPPAGRPLQEVMQEVEALGDRAQELEAALAASSALAASEIAKRRVSASSLSELLPKSSVLVEVIRFREVDWKLGRWADSHRYAAFVLRSKGTIAWIDLGPAEELEATVSSLMRGLGSDPRSRRGQRLQQASVDRLYARLWSPLEEATSGSSKIWISPDGLLNTVPFAALRAPDGRYLVESHALAYVSSGRDLASSAETEPDRDLFLIANPSFGAQGETAPSPADATLESRSPWLGLGQTFSFAPLPGTTLEAAGIPELLPGSRDSVLEGEAATEEALFESGSPRVMHLATHGFFLPGDSEELGAVGEGTRLRVGANPLVRSGLALAGANRAAAADSGFDGLLTALEVSSLDLRGTDLVTLSACDTGRGEVLHGEGVFGLRRAFALAGARHLMMSLWPVADEITAEQMLVFYRHYGEGVDPATALRTAQLSSIEEIRESLGSAPPSLWAAFILQGQGVSE